MAEAEIMEAGIPDGRPFDQQLGYDVPRVWATGAQVFVNPDHVLIVFREQTGVAKDGHTEIFIRNVGSVVMPREVAKQLHKALGTTLDMAENGAE